MNLIRAVKGMNDLFGDELSLWHFIEKTTHEVFSRYGLSEIRTPILEDLSLFVRSVGEGTDIVEKEMYVLRDRDESMLCLRPENTASVVRALIEKKVFAQENEFKTYYLGPMFRRERPQKGRLRQFHQVGAEIFGISEPSADVELIAMMHHYFSKLGLDGLSLKLNSLGDHDQRQKYIDQLVGFYSKNIDKLCNDCKTRLTKNPLRLLDCKNSVCKDLSNEAPVIIDSLEGESEDHFSAVKEGLKELGIPFELSPRLVRGLDYYSRTVFELEANTGLGSQNAVAAGGRYDALVRNLGGPQVPALGFASGIERIVILLKEKGSTAKKETPDLSFVCMDDKDRALALKKCIELRTQGIFAEFDHKSRSLKSQMRRADKIGSSTIIVLGETERQENKGQLKNLKSGASTEVSLDTDSILTALQGEEA